MIRRLAALILAYSRKPTPKPDYKAKARQMREELGLPVDPRLT